MCQHCRVGWSVAYSPGNLLGGGGKFECLGGGGGNWSI